MEIIKSKTFKIIVSVLGLIISYKLTEIYLVRNFNYFGESYRKGLGHILTENFAKGSFFIFTRELLTSLFFSSVIYFLIQNNIRTIFKKFIVPIWVLILLAVTIFVGIKKYDIYIWNYDRKDRIIEISLTWYTRALGFLISYLIITKYMLSEKEKHYR
ncbi:hypothetical protein V3Q90_07190 [Flavobacterium oreochromis]|uniref:Exosortase K n=1 Tax=Flavobacterium oreochromis TaxID=2906078 RepID=A0ABW8PC28_9FLAO|nr:hypothetical protein [Flavobacterium oreochromis]